MSPTKLAVNLSNRIRSYVDKWQANALSSDTDIAAAEAAVSQIFKGERHKMKWVDYPLANKIVQHQGVTEFHIISRMLEQADTVMRTWRGTERRKAVFSFHQCTTSLPPSTLLRSIVEPIVARYYPMTNRESNNYRVRRKIHNRRDEMLRLYHWQKIVSSTDSHWALYEFFSSTIKDKAFEQIKPYIKLHRACGGAYISGDTIMLYPKPTHLHLDTRGRLHSPDSPALDFNGHYTVYALNGVVVEEKVVMRPNDITAAEIIREDNAQLAQIKLDRLTIPNFINKARPSILDTDHDANGNTRKLLSVFLNTDFSEPRIVCVQVICPSTDKTYLLRVPPTIETCAEAIAWTFNVDKKDYAPIVER